MLVLQLIVGLATLIFLHEVGHFLAAKLLKVEVEEFGFGFPPRAVKLFTYKGTLYSLNWLPFGGFVRLKGENDPEAEGGLAAANPWVRLGVLFAGPLMNLTATVILLSILFFNLGDPVMEKVRVSFVEPGTPAESAGLLIGDLFVSVNDTPIDSSEALLEVITANLGQTIEIVVDRNGSIFETTLAPRTEWPEGQGPIGIGLDHPKKPVNLGTAIGRGFSGTYYYARELALFGSRLVRGQVESSQGRLLGYKGMYDLYEYTQERSISPLEFFAQISLSLGLINLLPLPAIDGGRILFALPEIIFRRRIPQNFEATVHLAGFLLLLLVLVYVNIMDFVNPIVLP